MVKLHKFTSREENLSGADWLWWIGDKSRGVLLQIQAKKLLIGGAADGTYHELRKASASAQFSTLVTDSRRRNAFSIYCFYNSMVPWRHVYPQSGTACCRWPGGVPEPYKLTGCLITSPWHAKVLMDSGTADFANVQSVSLPWDCLVCCSNREAKRKTLAERTLPRLGG